MEHKLAFQIKIKYFTWKNYILIIRKNDFQLLKENANKKKLKTYSLINTVILDKSEKTDQKLLITSPFYNFLIKIIKPEDKKIILSKFEEIIKKNSEKTAFSKVYLDHLKTISNHEEKNLSDEILFKFNTCKILMDEINNQLLKFKNLINEKLNGQITREFLSVHNDIDTIISEMKRQFIKIEKRVKKNFLKNNDKDENEKESSSSSEEEEKIDWNLDEEKEIILNSNNKISQNHPYFLNTSLLDYYNPNYEFRERIKLSKNIKCPENIIKEMITIFTKKLPSPIYFNEPLSMGQKQCEKFFYLDLLTKASKEVNNKPLQMCYISAFIIGEIFLNIGRFLKPFNPILGETYEYFENYHKFRYYSEQVKHKPQINAFIGETPEFAYYGDTLGDTSFKFLKGIELNFKNNIHIYLKKSGIHYEFNRPLIYVKGLMKPPLYNDYAGTTIIRDINDKNIKCELNFIEQSWSSNELGNFEGKAYSNENEVKYLIGGNWQEEIYITDPEGNNKNVLLSLNKASTYLQNNTEKYTLPFYSCNLNYANESLKNSLPKNDSRFRRDIRLLEKGEDYISKAQLYKNAYEEKQRKEIKDEGHEILFFDEKINEETEVNYYIPNGKYWELKKNGQLNNNKYKDIFEIEEYLEKEEEKYKEEKDKEEKDKEEKYKEKGEKEKAEKEKEGKENRNEKLPNQEKEEKEKEKEEKENIENNKEVKEEVQNNNKNNEKKEKGKENEINNDNIKKKVEEKENIIKSEKEKKEKNSEEQNIIKVKEEKVEKIIEIKEEKEKSIKNKMEKDKSEEK